MGSTVRAPDQLKTSAVVECKVHGCGWRAEIPVLYRIEPVLEPWADLGRGLEYVPTNVRVVVDRAAVEAFDTYVAGHLAQHEIAETLLEHLAPPVVDPPRWHEVEWCDDGGSCEHPSCLEHTSVEAAWRDDEPEGWRIP